MCIQNISLVYTEYISSICKVYKKQKLEYHKIRHTEKYNIIKMFTDLQIYRFTGLQVYRFSKSDH